jgi:hypothetical protein
MKVYELRLHDGKSTIYQALFTCKNAAFNRFNELMNNGDNPYYAREVRQARIYTLESVPKCTEFKVVDCWLFGS